VTSIPREPADRAFDGVRGRATVDYVLRNVHQQLVALSSQADLKANIMITVTAILLSLSLTHLDEGRLRPSAITFAGFLLAALIFALLSVLPKFPFPGQRRRERRAPRDLLFFNHVAAMPRDEYVRAMAGVLEKDSSAYEARQRHRLEQRTLQPEERLLALEASGVPDQRSARPDHAMAGEDDRDRVPVHRPADRAGRLRAADLRRQGAVGRHLSVRDTRELVERQAVELADRGEVEIEVEGPPVPFEVLVELATDRVEPAGHPQDPGAEVDGELVECLVRPVGDPAEAAVGDGDEQLADRRVGQVVGNVDEALPIGGVAKTAVESSGDGCHLVSFLRSRRTPADAAWRAASSDDPSAAPIAAYGMS
jgi:pycsar effector protein